MLDKIKFWQGSECLVVTMNLNIQFYVYFIQCIIIKTRIMERKLILVFSMTFTYCKSKTMHARLIGFN